MLKSERVAERKMSKAPIKEAGFSRELMIAITALVTFIGQQMPSLASEKDREFQVKKYVLEKWFFDSEKSKKDTVCLKDLNKSGEHKGIELASRNEIHEKILTHFRAQGIDIHDREKCYMVDFEMFSPEGKSAIEISIKIFPQSNPSLYSVNTAVWYDPLGCGLHGHEVSFKNGIIKIESSKLLKTC